jgi:hypothetical protein
LFLNLSEYHGIPWTYYRNTTESNALEYPNISNLWKHKKHILAAEGGWCPPGYVPWIKGKSGNDRLNPFESRTHDNP